MNAKILRKIMSIRLSGDQPKKWQARQGGSRGQWLALGAALLLAACGSDADLGSPGYVQGFAGAVVADEPHAALIGRDTLAAGGSAGDAAAAAFFALAVTKPASAGLTAHGYCLDYRVEDQTHQAYRFQSPGAVRAMAAIHARLGRLPWRQTVGPAEALARFGQKRSLAFQADWQAAAPADSSAQQVFGGGAVGQEFRQLDLAGLLGQIRQQGAGSFYTGGAAQQVWQAAEDGGLRVDREFWRDIRPEAAAAVTRPLGDHLLASLPFSDAGNGGTTGRAETGLAVADQVGNAVACVFSMGQPFGDGQLIGGVFLASSGAPAGVPVLVSNPNTKIMLAAIAGGNGSAAAEQLADQTVERRVPLAQAIGSGHAGLINAVVCPRGLPNYPQSCTAASDPAGDGLAAIGEPQR